MPAGRVPDMRGMFLRGHGSQASTHFGEVTHQSGALGAIQGDAIRNIVGTGELFHAGFASGTGAFYAIGSGGTGGPFHTGYAAIWGFDASRVVPTATEIRPANTAVRYLIRARP
jgi:hypothetical protein